MITPTQMRAARAMLDVSQGHVAQYLGIAANTLSKIESGQSDVSGTRLTDIQRFYEREGVEFTADDGVKWNTGGVVALRGKSGFIEFIDDVYDTLKNGGEAFVNNVKEDWFLKWLGDYAYEHMGQMQRVSGLRFKILVVEGDENTVASDYAEYRELPPNNFGDIPLYIYGDKTALIVFDDEDVNVFLIKHKAITNYFIKRFYLSWEQATIK